jgi:hypothetical protein
MAIDTPMAIRRGTTLQWVIRVEQPVAVYVPISAIDNTAPARIHATAHGLYDGQRFAIEGAKVLTSLNARYSPPKASDYFKSVYVDDDTIDINEVNAINLPAYTSGGAIRYNTPFDLTGYGIFMQARHSERSDTVLFEASTLDGGIVIAVDGLSALVTVAADTLSAITARSGVFDVEFVAPGGAVPFATPQRKIEFAGEITRV